MGTSSGALIGALYSAGYNPEDILEKIISTKFLDVVSITPFDFSGLFSLNPTIEYLKKYLPQNFEDLHVKFSCCVVNRNKKHLIVDSGDLVSAVCASFSIPRIFKPVKIDCISDGPFQDGGIVDRIGLYNRIINDNISRDEITLIHLIKKSQSVSSNNFYDDLLNRYENIKILRSEATGERIFKSKKTIEQYKYSKDKLKKDMLHLLLNDN